MDPVNYVTVHMHFLHPACVKTFLVTFILEILFSGFRMEYGLFNFFPLKEFWEFLG